MIQNVFFSGNIGFKIEIDYVSGDRPDVCMAHQKVDLTIEKVTSGLTLTVYVTSFHRCQLILFIKFH